MSDINIAAVPLRLENVTKRFRQGPIVVEALRNVSLEVERGEFVAVMGASGSGKSTLLHVIAGLTRPDEGCVLVDGDDISKMPDRQLTALRRRRVGLVFQAFNLIAALTAEQNILLPTFAERSRDSIAERYEDLLAKLDLSQKKQSRPDSLSGGQQQRVAIARALIAEPSIILADEPTGSLDSTSGQDLCRLLRTLCDERRRTIMLVTHEPAVAVWSSRTLVLKDGRLIADFHTADYGDALRLAAHYQELTSTPAAAEARG
jgi:putative ABC transport system ATP-binding protein